MTSLVQDQLDAEIERARRRVAAEIEAEIAAARVAQPEPGLGELLRRGARGTLSTLGQLARGTAQFGVNVARSGANLLSGADPTAPTPGELGQELIQGTVAGVRAPFDVYAQARDPLAPPVTPEQAAGAFTTGAATVLGLRELGAVNLRRGAPALRAVPEVARAAPDLPRPPMTPGPLLEPHPALLEPRVAASPREIGTPADLPPPTSPVLEPALRTIEPQLRQEPVLLDEAGNVVRAREEAFDVYQEPRQLEQAPSTVPGTDLPLAGGPSVDLATARAQARSAIAPTPGRPSTSAAAQELARTAYQSTVRFTQAVDQVAQKLAGEAGLPAHRNPAEFMALANATSAHTHQWLAGGGPFRFLPDGNLEFLGIPTLEQAWRVAQTTETKNFFEDYSFARRSLELHEQGRSAAATMSPEAAQRIVQEAPGEFASAFDAQLANMNAAVNYAVEAGALSPEAAMAMLDMGKNFVPLHRVLAAHRGSFRPTNPFKRLVGSRLQVESMYISVPEHITRVIQAADMARPAKLLAELADANPDVARELGIERVAEASDATIAARATRLIEEARQHGIELSQEVATELAAKLSDTGLRLEGNVIDLVRNGRREAWRVPDAVADSFRALSPGELHFAVRLFGAVAGGLKVGVTTNPVFAIMNFISDQFVAGVQSQHGYIPFVDGIRGLMETIRQGPAFQEMQATGGGFGLIASGRGLGASIPGAVGEAFAQSARRARTMQLLPQSNRAVVLEHFAHPLDAMRAVFEPLEQATRVGEFTRARQAGKSAVEGARASQDVSVNFFMHGSSPAVRAWAHMTAFMNPGIQALNQMATSSGLNPFALQTPALRGKLAAKVLGTGLATITVPTALLWLANKDDADITELRQTPDGANYWYFRFGDNAIGRVRKPHAYGQFFGTTIERALDAAYLNDPDAATELVESFTRQLRTNIIPTAAQIVYDVGRNRSSYSGASIVPKSQADNLPLELQATPHTGATARVLGRQLGVAPAMFEYVLRQSTGRLGVDFLRLVDHVVQTGETTPPSRTIVDEPIFGGFFAQAPSYAAASLRRFYERADESVRWYNALRTAQTPEVAQRFLAEHEAEIQLAPLYEATKQQLGAMHQQATAVYLAQGMDPMEKQQTIQAIIRSMIQIARSTNTAVEAARSQ